MGCNAFLDTLLMVLMACFLFEILRAAKRHLEIEKITEELKSNVSSGMTEEDLKEFYEADAAATNEFYKAISELNAFMTDKEVMDDVGEQED